MNKTKIILLSIGGVTAVGTLVLAYLIWSAWESKSECEADYESACDSVSQLMAGVKAGGEKVFPGPLSVKAIDENRERLAQWTDDSKTLASVGDRKFEPTSPASFKARLVEDARRLSALPGSVAGKFVKADFGFGFNSFIVGGELPKDAELPQLQREWSDVLLILDTLAEAGATSLETVEVKRQTAPKEERNARGRKKAKVDAAEAEKKPTATTVALQFTAPSDALVRALNALTASDRFMVVDSLVFGRSADPIAEKLDGDAKKSAGAASRSARRGRRIAAKRQEANEEESEKKHGVITDPQNAPDLKVAMQVSVYDFRTAEKPAATDDVKATEEKK